MQGWVGTQAVLDQGPAAGSRAAGAWAGPWVLTAYMDAYRHADVLFNPGAEHQQDTWLNKYKPLSRKRFRKYSNNVVIGSFPFPSFSFFFSFPFLLSVVTYKGGFSKEHPHHILHGSKPWGALHEVAQVAMAVGRRVAGNGRGGPAALKRW